MYQIQIRLPLSEFFAAHIFQEKILRKHIEMTKTLDYINVLLD